MKGCVEVYSVRLRPRQTVGRKYRFLVPVETLLIGQSPSLKPMHCQMQSPPHKFVTTDFVMNLAYLAIFVNDKAVCRTAPATQGLLKTERWTNTLVYLRDSK